MSCTPRKVTKYPRGHDNSTGPYSPALAVGDIVFVSGQGPLDPKTEEIKGDTIEKQAELTLKNVQAALTAAGCSMQDVVKTTVHLSDMANYDRFNKIYRKFFKPPYPARTLVQSVLWHHILVEVDVIAMKGCGK